jgi:hypothetical protein
MGLRVSRIAAALLLTSALGGAAQAQTSRFHLGPRISYQFDLEKIGIGAQFSAPIAHHLEFYPSFDYFLDSGSFWNLNADFKYRIPSESVRWLYLGAGLNLAHAADETRAGLNLLAGVESLKGRVHPFAEFRFTANHGSTGQIAAGLNFTLGSH